MYIINGYIDMDKALELEIMTKSALPDFIATYYKHEWCQWVEKYNCFPTIEVVDTHELDKGKSNWQTDICRRGEGSEAQHYIPESSAYSEYFIQKEVNIQPILTAWL